jgi:hypothetical protein
VTGSLKVPKAKGKLDSPQPVPEVEVISDLDSTPEKKFSPIPTRMTIKVNSQSAKARGEVPERSAHFQEACLRRRSPRVSTSRASLKIPSQRCRNSLRFSES